LNTNVPVLVDIYADPLVSEVCTIYPVDKPIISIPRMRIRAVTSSYDGSTETSQIIPSAVSLVRANEETVVVTPNTNYNMYTGLGFTNSTHKMNRRYTLLTNVTITENKDGGGTKTHSVSVSFRPDARNQISRTFTFTASDGEVVTGNIMANVNYDSGTATAQVTFAVGVGDVTTFECENITFKLRFRPVGSNNGRTRVSVTTEMIDCVIDPKQHWGLC
jgi:hypothetical protein